MPSRINAALALSLPSLSSLSLSLSLFSPRPGGEKCCVLQCLVRSNLISLLAAEKEIIGFDRIESPRSKGEEAQRAA